MSNTRIPLQLLDHELAQEKASALGRLGRAFEETLAALRAFDVAHVDAPLSPDQHQLRRTLVQQASGSLWLFVVQREACGLRDMRYLLRDYRVPAEVVARMGAMPVSYRL